MQRSKCMITLEAHFKQHSTEVHVHWRPLTQQICLNNHPYALHKTIFYDIFPDE